MTRVAYFALGGTIAMTPAPAGGVHATLTGEDLLPTAGPLPFDVDVTTPSAGPSAGLTFGALLDVVDLARRAVDDGADGVVLSQGTDTLEETSYVIDCVWDRDAPFVVTGAMRNTTQPGHEGPANLRAALLTAAAPAAGGLGVLVAFADELHAARHVRKTHTSGIDTFASPDLGPIGAVVEDRPRMLASVPRLPPVVGVDREVLARTRVGLYTAVLDAPSGEPEVFDAYDGLVIAGSGAGHVAGHQVPAVTALAEHMPVVLTSRAGSGWSLQHTYAAPGAEIDLLGRGLISGGLVPPVKARVLLRLLLAAGAAREEIAAAFAARS